MCSLLFMFTTFVNYEIGKIGNFRNSSLFSYHSFEIIVIWLIGQGLSAGLGTNVPQQDILGGVGISIHH